MRYILFIGLLVSSLVHADGMLHVPPWTMVNGKACYEFLDAKKLLILDADLEALLQEEATQTRIIAELKLTVKKYQEALAAEKSAFGTLQHSNDILNRMLLKETTRANNAEARPGPFPAWAIAGGVGIAVGIVAGVVLGVYVAK